MGNAIISKLRKHWRSNTAFAAEFDQQQAISAGFQIHIPKPVQPETLAAAVLQLVKQHSTTDEHS